MSPSRLLLGALAALVLVVGLFLVLGGDEGEGSAAGPVAAVPGGEAEAEETAAALTPGRADRDAGNDAPRASIATGTERVSIAGRRVTVRLELPTGSPPDTELAIVAVPGAWLEDERGSEVLSDLRTGALDAEETVRVAVVSSTLELPLPTALDDPKLLLDGRFLFLAEPVAVTDDASEVLLAPELGAALAVRFAPPANVEPAGELSLFGGDFSGRGGGWDRREREVGAEGTVFRALDPSLVWNVSPSLDALHGYAESGLELEAGTELVLELELTLGVTVTGVVVDEDARPLEGAEVRAAGRRGWWGGGNARETTTDEDGRFELVALPPGDVKVEAELEGRLSAESETFERSDGERVDGLRLVLDSGLSIAGTVRAADLVVEGTRILVETRSSGAGWGGWGGGTRVERVGEVEADEDGVFRVSGLEEGKYSVHAVLAASDDEDAPRWRASAESVPAGTSDLVLDLAGPLTFEGRVVDDRGEPVTTFVVVANSVLDGGPRERVDFEDENGAFTFARVGPGEWEIDARADGYEDSEPVPLTLPASGEPIVLRLDRQAVVSGRVLDSTGVPAAGATVRADDGRGSPWGGRGGPRTETDAEGRFVLESLAPGGTTIVARSEVQADSEELALELAPGQRLEEVELRLRDGGRLFGQVISPEGNPQPGRQVTWGSNVGPWGARGDTTTDAAGRFSFDHVTPGEWSVAAGPTMAEMSRRMRGQGGQTAFIDAMSDLDVETVTIVDGEETEVFLGGEPKRPVRIYGVVTRNGQPLEDAQVYAVSEGSAVFEGMKAGVSTADGSYELTVDRPGPYAVSVSSGRIGAEVLVDVPRADETRVDLSIPLGRIEGVVRGPDGERAEGVRLSIQREDGLGRMRWNGSQATTDANGEYAFEDLEAGRYTVRANTPGWGGRSSAGEDWGTAVSSGVAVGEDLTTSGIDFRLETAGTVKGLVRDQEGAPLSGVSLFFRDEAGRLVSSVSGARTDAAGRFEESGLAPGRYTLSARGEGFAANEAVSVEVRSSEISEVELEVETGTTVLVTLEDPAGNARRCRVEVFDRDGVEVGGLVTVEALQSAFSEGASSRERRVGPLPPGRYTVRATMPDGTSEERRVTLRGRESEKTVTLRLKE